MGALIRRPYAEAGNLRLAFGKHEMVFNRGYRPKRVLIHINNEYGFPICHGDLNYVAATVIDEGFVLHADIKSNEAYIIWMTLTEDVV